MPQLERTIENITQTVRIRRDVKDIEHRRAELEETLEHRALSD